MVRRAPGTGFSPMKLLPYNHPLSSLFPVAAQVGDIDARPANFATIPVWLLLINE